MSRTIITFLSPARDNVQEVEYRTGVPEPPVIKGAQTNDAPVKYFMHIDGAVEKIICFRTQEAESAFDKLADTAKNETAAMGLSEPDIKAIPYTETAEGINSALEKLVDLLENGDEIYLDITGGFRHANYLTMLMLKFADFIDKNIRVNRVVYANFSTSPKCITDITDIYKLFDLVNGAQNFTSFGNSELLEKYFDENVSGDRRISELVKCMRDFSEAVTLCKTNSIDGITERMNALITEIQSSAPTDNKGEMFFRKIIDVIRMKFGLTGSDSLNYLNIIRWCVQNGMLQQALTLYVEKVPKYLLDRENGIIKASDKIRKQAVKQIYDEDYTLFFEKFLALTDINDQYVKEMRKYLSSHAGQIVGSADADDYFTKTEGETYSDTIHVKEMIECVYRIKRCHFSDCNVRLSDEEALSNYDAEGKRELYTVVSYLESNPGSFKKFVNCLSSSEYLIKILHSPYLIHEFAHNEAVAEESKRQKHSLMKKLYAIENVEPALKVSKDFSVSVTDFSKLSEFMRDYLYVKQYLRNQINHAADETSLDSSILDYFRSYGYVVNDDQITVRYVIKLIEHSLDTLNVLETGE